MKIIISPAKQMVSCEDDVAPTALPVYLDKAESVLEYLRSLSFSDIHALWGCSESLAESAYSQLQDIRLENAGQLTPAILAYDGIAYKYMAPRVFEGNQFDYVQDHLVILSGFYGALRPLDGVMPYRLEMQAKAKVCGKRNLYDFWGSSLYDAARGADGVIVNLASKEYSKCVEKYLAEDDRFITCVFGELSGTKVVQKGVYAKMARGDMVRYLAEDSIEDPEDMKKYTGLGYSFSEGHSNESTYVFLKQS